MAFCEKCRNRSAFRLDFGYCDALAAALRYPGDWARFRIRQLDSPMGIDTERVLLAVRAGDDSANEELFVLHYPRLRRLIAARMDTRLRQRVSPSDVIQETWIEAYRRLPAYLETEPIGFFPWLLQIAFNRLTDFHRRHVLASKRSVLRECDYWLPAGSASQPARNLIDNLAGPEQGSIIAHERERLNWALGQLDDLEREIVLLRHMERRSVAELAQVFKLPESTVKSKHFRALKKLRNLLGKAQESDSW